MHVNGWPLNSLSFVAIAKQFFNKIIKVGKKYILIFLHFARRDTPRSTHVDGGATGRGRKKRESSFRISTSIQDTVYMYCTHRECVSLFSMVTTTATLSLSLCLSVYLSTARPTSSTGTWHCRWSLVARWMDGWTDGLFCPLLAFSSLSLSLSLSLAENSSQQPKDRKSGKQRKRGKFSIGDSFSSLHWTFHPSIQPGFCYIQSVCTFIYMYNVRSRSKKAPKGKGFSFLTHFLP